MGEVEGVWVVGLWSEWVEERSTTMGSTLSSSSSTISGSSWGFGLFDDFTTAISRPLRRFDGRGGGRSVALFSPSSGIWPE